MLHSRIEDKYCQLLNICLQTYKNIQKTHGYQSGKSFFGSQAYNFFQELIHLHTKEINELIRKILKERGGNMDIERQTLSLDEINKDQKEVSSWKNLYFPEGLWEKVQRLIKFHLQSECKDKSSLQLQNIELQIQCSLNYSCPKCMIGENKESPKSMEFIECQNQLDEETTINREYQTMKLIKDDPRVASTKEEHKLQNIFEHMRRQRQKQIEMKRQHNREISKWWKNVGNLMDLEKKPFDPSNHPVSIQTRKEELFKQIYFRNITNEKMIHNFCDKFNKKSHRKLSRSLSINHHIDEDNEDENQQKTLKLYSMKDLAKEAKPSNKKNTTPERKMIIHPQRKMATPQIMVQPKKRGFQVSPAKKFDIFNGTCQPMPVHKVKIGEAEFHENCHGERSFRLKAIDRTILLHS